MMRVHCRGSVGPDNLTHLTISTRRVPGMLTFAGLTVRDERWVRSLLPVLNGAEYTHVRRSVR
jgi:hypothetical protein